MAELSERAGAEAFASAVARMLAEADPILDERQRRVLMGAGARQLGRGGIKLIAAATGASADTVGRGAAEVEAGLVADGRVRAKGAGRPAVQDKDPGVWPALEKLVDPVTRGDPMSPLRWTTKSTVKLAMSSARRASGGTQDSGPVVERPRLQLAGQHQDDRRQQHPDRDAQFCYINEQVTVFLAAGSGSSRSTPRKRCDAMAHVASELADRRSDAMSDA